jgi:hypothetical protein
MAYTKWFPIIGALDLVRSACWRFLFIVAIVAHSRGSLPALFRVKERLAFHCRETSSLV